MALSQATHTRDSVHAGIQVPPNSTGLHVVECGHGGERFIREALSHETSREAVIRRIIGDQYDEPARVFAFDPIEGWARDASEEIARAVVQRALSEGRIAEGSLCRSAVEFCERHIPGWFYRTMAA